MEPSGRSKAGVVMIVSGPSGVGKLTVCRRLTERLDAMWEDGRVTLRRVEYDLASPLGALGQLPLDAPIVDDLAHMLQHARVN